MYTLISIAEVTIFILFIALSLGVPVLITSCIGRRHPLPPRTYRAAGYHSRGSDDAYGDDDDDRD